MLEKWASVLNSQALCSAFHDQTSSFIERYLILKVYVLFFKKMYFSNCRLAVSILECTECKYHTATKQLNVHFPKHQPITIVVWKRTSRHVFHDNVNSNG